MRKSCTNQIMQHILENEYSQNQFRNNWERALQNLWFDVICFFAYRQVSGYEYHVAGTFFTGRGSVSDVSLKRFCSSSATRQKDIFEAKLRLWSIATDGLHKHLHNQLSTSIHFVRTCRSRSCDPGLLKNPITNIQRSAADGCWGPLAAGHI